MAKKRKTTKRKSTRKGQIRKISRRAYVPKRKTRKRKTTKRKTSSKSKRRSSGMKLPKVPRLLQKAAMGVGLATIAGLVVSQVAPAYANIAKPIAGFIGGDVVGAASVVALDQLNGNGFSMGGREATAGVRGL